MIRSRERVHKRLRRSVSGPGKCVWVVGAGISFEIEPADETSPRISYCQDDALCCFEVHVPCRVQVVRELGMLSQPRGERSRSRAGWSQIGALRQC